MGRGSPSNHAHRHALVAAEIAALAGEQDRAIDLYDQAIKLARDSGFIQHEALANELAARFHLRKQRSQVARAYMQEAWYGYRQWGAKAKAKQLVERHPDLLAGVEQAPAPAPGPVALGSGRRRPAPPTRRAGSTWSPPCAPPRRWRASSSSAACSNA